MKPTRLYLSGPMRGLVSYNFPAFDAAAANLRDQGFIVYSPSDADRWMNLVGREVNARECFESDTHWICRYADAVVVLPGWEHSKGAQAEVALAHAIGIHVYDYEKELKK